MPEHSGPHILSKFDQDLESLRSHLATMSILTQTSLLNTQAGLFEKDSERCNAAIAGDEEIDAMERSISMDATSLIMRYQPVATDLRLVIATIKISVNLERIADQTVSIARRVRKLLSWTVIPDELLLTSLFNDVGKLLHHVIQAFVQRTPLSPNYLDPAFTALIRRVQAYADTVALRIPYELDQAVNACMDLVHISRLLEQIVGICRDIGKDTHFAIDPGFTSLPVPEI